MNIAYKLSEKAIDFLYDLKMISEANDNQYNKIMEYEILNDTENYYKHLEYLIIGLEVEKKLYEELKENKKLLTELLQYLEIQNGLQIDKIYECAMSTNQEIRALYRMAIRIFISKDNIESSYLNTYKQLNMMLLILIEKKINSETDEVNKKRYVAFKYSLLALDPELENESIYVDQDTMHAEINIPLMATYRNIISRTESSYHEEEKTKDDIFSGNVIRYKTLLDGIKNSGVDARFYQIMIEANLLLLTDDSYMEAIDDMWSLLTKDIETEDVYAAMPYRDKIIANILSQVEETRNIGIVHTMKNIKSSLSSKSNS